MDHVAVLTGTRPDPEMWPPPPAHIQGDRDAFETRNGVSYCRRCGRLLVSDRAGTSAASSTPCEVVRVGLR